MKANLTNVLGNGKARGFTLIEVILALGIFAIVMVAINTAFFAALRNAARNHSNKRFRSIMPYPCFAVT